MQKYEQRDRNPSTEGKLKRWKTECFAKLFTSYSIGNGELLKDAEPGCSRTTTSLWKEELLTDLCDTFKDSKSCKEFVT